MQISTDYKQWVNIGRRDNWRCPLTEKIKMREKTMLDFPYDNDKNLHLAEKDVTVSIGRKDKDENLY